MNPPLNYTIDREAGTVNVNGVEMDETDLVLLLTDLRGE